VQESEPAWSVVSVEMSADLTANDGGADVTIRYVLSGTPRGAPIPVDLPVDVSLLGFEDASASEFVLEGGPSIALRSASGSRRIASVRPVPGQIDDDVVRLGLSYRIERAVIEDGGTLRVRLPVLAGPSAPGAGEGGGFRARVITPRGWRVTEPFPSGLRADGEGVWSVSLPVVPAFVGFRGRLDGGWHPGLPLVADLLTLVVLAGVLIVGARHLRSMAA
jgi:hypothetical protein